MQIFKTIFQKKKTSKTFILKEKSLPSPDGMNQTYSTHPSDDSRERRQRRLFKRTNLERTNRTKKMTLKLFLHKMRLQWIHQRRTPSNKGLLWTR